MEATSIPKIVIPGRKVNATQFFYTGAAVFLFILMFWGFYLFYTHGQAYPGRPLTPPIRTLVISHGVIMTLWMMLFIAQPLLVATGNRRLHMKLGMFGTGLAAIATVLGVNLAVASARVTPPDWRLWGLNPKQFMMVSMSSIVLFAVFVTIGILKRKKPEVHRPMMLMVSLAILPPSLDRVTVVHNLFEGTVLGNLFGAYASSLVVGLVLVGLHGMLTRKLNQTLVIGLAAIAVVAFATMQLAPTRIWGDVANLLIY